MEDNLHKGANPRLFHFARLNRKAQTDAEQILWSLLRNRQLDGYKFRRQHPQFFSALEKRACNIIEVMAEQA